MARSHIDRLTDTTAFRAMLLLATLAVVPVLGMGVVITVLGSVAMLVDPYALELEQAMFAALSISGALGFVGYVRAHWGMKEPCRHNVTATLVCLVAGIAAALAVTGFMAVQGIASALTPWGRSPWLAFPALFTVANAVWALAGVAWMQRLMRRYAEQAGRGFDGLPVVLLVVALGLAIAAALLTTGL